MECETVKVPPYNDVINSFHSNSKFTEYLQMCMREPSILQSWDANRVGATMLFSSIIIMNFPLTI